MDQGVHDTARSTQCKSEDMLTWTIRRHYFAYLIIRTPAGLVLYPYGPEFVERHEMTLNRQSRLDEALEEHSEMNREQFCVLAHATFVIPAWIQVSFNRAFMSME